MQNKLIDLNNILFETVERLNDDDLVGTKLTEEIQRAKSIVGVAQAIVNNGNLMLDAQRFAFESASDQYELPTIMRIEDDKTPVHR